tara:strand:- start:384 stop:689 length:306 start_codon:yes stop_codon:yes gene_type:complete
MAYSFRGNINGSAVSDAVSLPTVINSFSVVNKTAATIGLNVYVINGAQQTCIAPNNLQLESGSMAFCERQIVLLATEQIKVQSSGSVDYDFTIDNLKVNGS